MPDNNYPIVNRTWKVGLILSALGWMVCYKYNMRSRNKVQKIANYDPYPPLYSKSVDAFFVITLFMKSGRRSRADQTGKDENLLAYLGCLIISFWEHPTWRFLFTR